MTEDERAFRKAICDAPADDGPRLVFADWLDEHDQPERAELIRVQCELAMQGLEHDLYAQKHLHDLILSNYKFRGEGIFSAKQLSEYRLLDYGAAIWMAREMPSGFFCGRDSFRRGFISRVQCPANKLVLLDEARKLNPITEIRLTSWPLTAIEDAQPDRRKVRLEGRKRAEYTISRFDMRNRTWPQMESDIIGWLCKAEWPGIKFSFPDQTPQRLFSNPNRGDERAGNPPLYIYRHPDFAGVTDWRQLSNAEYPPRPFMVHQVDEPVRFPWNEPPVLSETMFRTCRIPIQRFVVGTHECYAGRCEHGIAYYTPMLEMPLFFDEVMSPEQTRRAMGYFRSLR